MNATDIILERIKFQLKQQFKNRNMVLNIILVNVFFYLLGELFNLFGLFFGFQKELMVDLFSKKWLYIPSVFNEFLYKTYTLITYQFLHVGFFHLFSNMIIVYYFGNLFISLTHKKKLLPLYLLGGIFSGLIFLLAFNFIPSLEVQNVHLVGASGSAMAILGAVATLVPEKEVYLFGSFKVKFKWIAFSFLFFNLLTITVPNNAGNYAHIGGLLFGYVFIYLYKEGYDLAKPTNDILNYLFSFFIKDNKPKATYINEKFKNKKQFISKKPSVETQKKINAILDKISQSGYDKLTKAEKDFLFNNSKK